MLILLNYGLVIINIHILKAPNAQQLKVWFMILLMLFRCHTNSGKTDFVEIEPLDGKLLAGFI